MMVHIVSDYELIQGMQVQAVAETESQWKVQTRGEMRFPFL